MQEEQSQDSDMPANQSAPSVRGGASRFLILLGLSLLGCPAPGKGYKAEAGYRRAHPVIAAIDRYRQERGSYPDSLSQLPADWLPPPDSSGPPARGLVYKNHGERYELTFSYTGPGVNHCTYDSAGSDDSAARAATRWRCRGYY